MDDLEDSELTFNLITSVPKKKQEHLKKQHLKKELKKTCKN